MAQTYSVVLARWLLHSRGRTPAASEGDEFLTVGAAAPCKPRLLCPRVATQYYDRLQVISGASDLMCFAQAGVDISTGWRVYIMTDIRLRIRET